MFRIRPMRAQDVPKVTEWARREGFCPGPGDVSIFLRTDRAGVWVGWLEEEPIGCIVAVRYDGAYGFIGLFLVVPEHRGQGYGVALWKRALEHLTDVRCVGLEAAPERLEDYGSWGFRPAWTTHRWMRPCRPGESPRPGGRPPPLPPGYRIEPVGTVPEAEVLAYDAHHEATPRPHFLHEWLEEGCRHREDPGGDPEVLVVLDAADRCRGFARIRPCLLAPGAAASAGGCGWRIGPWLADAPALAAALLNGLTAGKEGPVLLDAPEANPYGRRLLEQLGFQAIAHTIRMYRGPTPWLPIGDIYGLACLELG